MKGLPEMGALFLALPNQRIVFEHSAPFEDQALIARTIPPS
jgi:hypothetical protein